MSLAASAGVVFAFVLDVVVGEPPSRVHPVAWFGWGAAPFDREWRRPLAVGVVVAGALPVVAACVVGGLVWLAGLPSPWSGTIASGVVLFVASSLRMLCSEARAVVDQTARDVTVARERLRSLAGRDASQLTAGQVRSAAVESLAENLADGLVATVLGFVGGLLVGVAVGDGSLPVQLAFAAAGATWVKAVNTLDSMLGYHSKPVGTAAARLDDLVMWLPARVSAVIIAFVAGEPRARLRGRTWARRPSSPNSGWPMATMAAVLDVRLEKPGAYVLNPDGRLPSVEDAHDAIAVTQRAGIGVFALAALGAGVVV